MNVAHRRPFNDVYRIIESDMMKTNFYASVASALYVDGKFVMDANYLIYDKKSILI